MRSLIAASLLLLVGTTAHAAPLVLDFTGDCDDCAGNDELYYQNPANLGDGLFQTVFARLTLFNYTPGTFINQIGGSSQGVTFSFSYFGSSLLEPLTVTSEDGGLLYGAILADGTILSTAFGPPLFFLAWDDRASSFNVDFAGAWDLRLAEFECICDIGINGQYTAASVPAPAGLALLGFGLLGFGARRAFA